VHAQNASGRTALVVAALAGHSAIVDMLLADGADIGCVDVDGYPIGHCLIIDGAIGLLDHVLACGANVDAVDASGRTAMHIAASMNDTKAIGVLVEHGANVELCDSDGRTALMTAVWRGHVSASQMLLVNANACPNTISESEVIIAYFSRISSNLFAKLPYYNGLIYCISSRFVGC
jgi:ankyrin repeat protein